MGNRVSRKLSEKRSLKREQKKRASVVMRPIETQNNSPKSSKRRPQVSQEKIQRLFDHYAQNNDTIGPEGVMQFCEDLAVDPEDVCNHLTLSTH